MPNVAVTGKDTVKINGRILNNFGDGDVAKLTFPNKLAEVKTGKNGNSMFLHNYSGQQGEFELRLLRGSADDNFMNNLLALYKNDPAAFVLLNGEFTKNIGDGLGNINPDTYILSGGIFSYNPEAVENAEADPNQAVTVWRMTFSNVARTMGQ